MQKTHFFDPPSFGNTLDAYLFGVKFGIESIAARSFPLLLAQTWPRNRAVMIEISGSEGFNVPLIERMQLVSLAVVADVRPGFASGYAHR